MKKSVLALGGHLFVGSALFAAQGPVHAAEVSANVALTSHYIFRGLDRSDGAPAIQGGFDYAFEKGLYLGIWGSSARTTNPVSGENESIETNYYLGFSHEFTQYGISLDVGLIQYDYPFVGLESNEVYVVGGYSFDKYGDLSASVWMDLDNSTVTVNGVKLPDTGNVGTYMYYNLGYDLPLPNQFDLKVSVGYQTYDGDLNAVTDYALAVKRPLAGVDLSLTYSSSNADINKRNFITLSASKKI
ncbi:MAG TPA: TorF family putative porin [Pseudomonadales bacterium]|nr:TorF family putative porin [Pseudomonadales bacterium]